MLSDRFCIHSYGDINETLAPQDMVACNFENFGCSGGQLITSIDFLEAEGIASESCMPYQDGDTYCNFKCIDTSQSYDKYYCKVGSMTIATTVEEI